MANMVGRLSIWRFRLAHDYQEAVEDRALPKYSPQSVVAIVVSFVKELPIPNSSPATGRTAMGSMKLRPTRAVQKNFVFHFYFLVPFGLSL